MFLSSKAALGRNPLLDRVGQKLLQKFGGAAAAYSLRALNGNSDNVVRVRRDSDNDEKDFTASDVSSGALTNWVNTQIVPPLDIGVETDDGRVPVSDGGTSIGEPAAAYSLRNLKPSYTGDVVDVRRSSDDATESFNATEVADGTLENWVGSGNDGFVSLWYDQSTNANHAVQTSPASQPKIVDSGSLVSGGLDFDGVDDFIQCAMGTIAQPISGFSVFKNDSLTFAPSIWDSTSATNRVLSYAVASDNTFRISAGSGVLSATSAHVNGTTYLRSDLINSTSSEGYVNGKLKISGDAGTNSMEGVTIGARYDGAINFTDGTIAEIIIYDTDQTDNRTAIEANIGETYGITGIPAYDNTVNGFVETWYDQSGNGNDAVQLTAGSQPKIVDSGSLVSGGLDFDGVDDFLATTQGYIVELSQNPASVFCVATPDNTGEGYLFTEGDGLDPYSSQFILNGVDGTATAWVNTTEFGSGFPASKAIGGFIYNGTEFQAYLNGSTDGASATVVINSETSVQSYIGTRADGTTDFFTGKVEELITYKSDQSANRTGIEDNINNYYNIY